MVLRIIDIMTHMDYIRVHRRFSFNRLCAFNSSTLSHPSSTVALGLDMDGASISSIPCKIECTTPCGMLPGTSPGGVRAYSNCRPECKTCEPLRLGSVYTGHKWQCVEYARRWLPVNKCAVFSEVDWLQIYGAGLIFYPRSH